MPEALLDPGELDVRPLPHAVCKPLEWQNLGVASPIVNSADVGTPDAAALGEPLLRSAGPCLI